MEFSVNPKEAVNELVHNKLDVNNDGTVDIQDIIIQALSVPGIHVDRESFLKKELGNKFSEDIVDLAILKTPAEAGIDVESLEDIANDIIVFERRCVSGISAALGMPGGVAMAATIPADIIQYYAYTLRATQKLLYLYGFPAIDLREDDISLDTHTINEIILCLGIMYGVAGANNAIKGMAKALANGVQKQLMNKALTKGAFYPMVKEVAKWFGVKMTKEVFTGFFKKAIPVVGGVVGGAITYASFKPCCDRLQKELKDTSLSNLNHIDSEEEETIYKDIIDIDDIDVSESE